MTFFARRTTPNDARTSECLRSPFSAATREFLYEAFCVWIACFGNVSCKNDEIFSILQMALRLHAWTVFYNTMLCHRVISIFTFYLWDSIGLFASVSASHSTVCFALLHFVLVPFMMKWSARAHFQCCVSPNLPSDNNRVSFVVFSTPTAHCSPMHTCKERMGRMGRKCERERRRQKHKAAHS